MLKKPKNTLRDEAQQKLRRRLYVIFLDPCTCASGAARTVVYTSLTLSWTLLTVPRREAARLASPQRLISRPSAAVAYERAIYSRLERFISLVYTASGPITLNAKSNAEALSINGKIKQCAFRFITSPSHPDAHVI